MPPTHLAFLHWFGDLNSGCQACVTQLSPELSNASPTACGLKATRKMFKPCCREAAGLLLHTHGSDFPLPGSCKLPRGQGVISSFGFSPVLPGATVLAWNILSVISKDVLVRNFFLKFLSFLVGQIKCPDASEATSINNGHRVWTTAH